MHHILNVKILNVDFYFDFHFSLVLIPVLLNVFYLYLDTFDIWKIDHVLQIDRVSVVPLYNVYNFYDHR